MDEYADIAHEHGPRCFVRRWLIAMAGPCSSARPKAATIFFEIYDYARATQIPNGSRSMLRADETHILDRRTSSTIMRALLTPEQFAQELLFTSTQPC